MDNVLIDTDVLLDFFFDRAPFSEHSTTILNLCEEKQINGFVTPVIISNVYYLLRKTAKHQLVIEKLKQLLSIIDIIKIDNNVVFEALNSEFKDFEDALQNFSAVQNETIQMIVTRNITDFQKSNLAILTPEIYLKGRTT